MADLAKHRVTQEMKMSKTLDLDQTIQIEVFKKIWSHFKCVIIGPQDTPYAGGHFRLRIVIPRNYPFSPPAVRLLTKIWHPNLTYGAVDLNILKHDWSPILNMPGILLTIRGLLILPVSQNKSSACGKQYNENIDVFKKTATHWTNVYAGGPNEVREYDNQIYILVGMGIEEHEARVALSQNDWDIKQAIRAIQLNSSN